MLQTVVFMRTGNKQQAGFILIGLLVLIMIAGFVLAAAGVKWSEARKREREQELLKVGDTIRKAIGSYYNQTPGVIKQYPPNLEALLKDDRFPVPRRYLRKIYADPITQVPDWGILQAPSGGVLGVYSKSPLRPLKTKKFRSVYRHFENQQAYEGWFFAYLPEANR